MLKQLGLIALASAALLAGARAEAKCTIGNSTTAITSCGDLPNPVYISGSTALQPLYNALGEQYLNASTNPFAVVYLTAGQGSCTGVQAQVAGTAIPSATTATWSDATGNVCTCTVPDSTQVTVGVADVFADTCGVTAAQLTTAGLQDFHGPVNAMTFVVPQSSTATGISAEQAYLAFGFGAMYSVTPWTDPSFYWIRPQVSGTLHMLAVYTLNNVAKWLGWADHSGAGVGCSDTTVAGCTTNGSGDVYAAIAAGNNSADADKFIGILGLDYLLTHTTTGIKTLAFRAFGQRYAYWPDSTATGVDKRNVRDGHYAAAGPAHFFAVSSGGTPTNASAATLVSRLVSSMSQTDTQSLADFQTLATSVHLVPTCAMSVQRSTDGADLTALTPTNPCDCYYEIAVGASSKPGCANAAPALNECSSTTACAKGTCRRGVCEVR